MDWYKFNASKGDNSGKNAHHIYLDLVDIATANGVFMELYAPTPHPHKLGTSRIHDKDIAGSEANFNMVAPLNGTYYLKVMSNGKPTFFNETYILNYVIVEIAHNVAYDGDNSFTAPSIRWIDSTGNGDTNYSILLNNKMIDIETKKIIDFLNNLGFVKSKNS